jgi:hypothetical protein
MDLLLKKYLSLIKPLKNLIKLLLDAFLPE